MVFRKRDNDIELAGMAEPAQTKTREDLDETNYQPVNWKKVLFSPKYIRMTLARAHFTPWPSLDRATDSQSSMAYPVYPDRYCHGSDHNTARRGGRSTLRPPDEMARRRMEFAD